MKSILLVLCGFLITANAFSQTTTVGVFQPTLAETSRLSRAKAVLYTPITVHSSHNLRFTLGTFGDGSVRTGKPFRFYKLLIFATQADGTGNHTLLKELNFIPQDASSAYKLEDVIVSSFTTAGDRDAGGRVSITCALIGLLQPADPLLAPTPTVIPINTTFSIEVFDPGDTSVGLLLPAVQKVRSAR